MLKDKDIREPLFDFLEETYGKIRILEEKTMGRSRADAVMVMENALCGIEIKSDADTYARLQRQVKDYDLYYDFNYAVVGTSHALHVKEHLPDWWGVITAELAEGRVVLYSEKTHAQSQGGPGQAAWPALEAGAFTDSGVERASRIPGKEQAVRPEKTAGTCAGCPFAASDV